MKHGKHCFLALAFFFAFAVFVVPNLQAQRRTAFTIVDSLSRVPLPGVNAMLFSADSSLIKGIASDTAGKIHFSISPRSKYILRVSMIGYKSKYINLPQSKSDKTGRNDTIELSIDAVTLKGATVIGKRPGIAFTEDTTSFNAEEYNISEGESLEELVKQIPGIEIDGSTITYNGKAISEFKVNGKDFFKGNRSVALKNLPVELIKKLKTYEKKSDYAEQTGIDDGNEQTVMDIELKKELNETWTTNYSAGIGSKGRYLQKLFANRITDRSRLTVTANLNDDDARSNNKSFGTDFSTNNNRTKKEKGRFEIGGHVGWHDNRSHSQTWRSSENYTGTSASSQFSNSYSYNKAKSAGWSGNVRMEWHPDTLTTVTANGNINISRSGSFARSQSARFNSDPYGLTESKNPLSDIFSDNFSEETNPGLYRAAINSKNNTSKSRSHKNSFQLKSMFVRRLNRQGRNVSLDFNISNDESWSKNFRKADIHYYKKTSGSKRTFQDQYTYSPANSSSYDIRASYSEPLAKGLHMQLSYRFKRSQSRSDRSLYRLDSLPEWDYAAHEPGDLPLGADTLQQALDMQNSLYSTYRHSYNTWRAALNYNTKKINSFAATGISYHTTRLDYRRSIVDTTLYRRLTRFIPSAMFRYRFSKHERMEIRYNGWNEEPSMTNRIPAVDNADPLNIHLSGGNLKPAWNNQIKFSYNKYIMKRQQNWNVNMQFNQSSNNISTAITYDETTGARTTRQRNIDGNWSARTDFSFSTAFGERQSFKLSTATTADYDNSVGFISSGNAACKNTTKTTGIFQRANLRYTQKTFEAKIGASLRWRHTDNKLRPQSNMDTYRYSFSASARIKTPWKMTLESSLQNNSRRGYSSKSMNTDELIWNASIAQNFLKGSPLILRLKINDILHQRSNIARTINAQSRTDTESDAQYSYFMLTVVLRLNVYNGKVSSGFNREKRK